VNSLARLSQNDVPPVRQLEMIDCDHPGAMMNIPNLDRPIVDMARIALGSKIISEANRGAVRFKESKGFLDRPSLYLKHFIM
jgi:hypothetical protein